MFSCDTRRAVEEDLRHKSIDRSYECEWRIVRREPSDEYMTYDPEDLVYIILGEKTSDLVKEIIRLFAAVPMYGVVSELQNDCLTICNLDTKKAIREDRELIADIEETRVL